MRLPLPQVEPDPTLPGSVTVYEVGPRDGLQNESTVVPAAVKAEFVRRLAGGGPVDGRDDVVRRPALGAPARRRRGAARPARRRGARAAAPGAGAQRARPGPGAGGGRAARSRCSAARPRPSRARTSTAPSPSQFEMFRPVVERARAEGLWVRGYVSMCFGDPWEGAGAGRPRSSTSAARLIDLGCDAAVASATRSASAPPGTCTALLEALGAAGHRRRPSWRCTSTTPTARRWPTRWRRCATGSPLVDASTGGLGGCPYAEVGDRQPRDRGPRLGARTGPASRPASTSTRSSRRACGWPSSSAGPSPSSVVRALSGG